MDSVSPWTTCWSFTGLATLTASLTVTVKVLVTVTGVEEASVALRVTVAVPEEAADMVTVSPSRLTATTAGALLVGSGKLMSPVPPLNTDAKVSVLVSPTFRVRSRSSEEGVRAAALVTVNVAEATAPKESTASTVTVADPTSAPPVMVRSLPATLAVVGLVTPVASEETAE